MLYTEGVYTQRFYDSQGNVQFTDETKQSICVLKIVPWCSRENNFP